MSDISPIVDRNISSLSLLCTSMPRMSELGSGPSGEMPCPVPYKPSKLARWTKRPFSVSQQLRNKTAFQSFIVLFVHYSALF